MAAELRPYLVVTCRTTKTIHVFARCTTAGDALAIMNRKLKEPFDMEVLHIEAVNKRNEEPPIVFAPDSVLENFGDDWELVTFTEADEMYIGGYVELPYPSSKLEESSRPNKKRNLEEFGRINDSTEATIEGRNDQVSEKPEGTCIQESQAGGGNVDSAAEESQAGVNN